MDVMKWWLVDPKSNTSPPVCCAAEAALPKLFSLEAVPNPPLMRVFPPHMPSGRSSRSKRPTLSECVFQLGDPTVNQSAMEFPNLCF